MLLNYKPIGVFRTEVYPGTGATRQASLSPENHEQIEKELGTMD
jgi:hypothetical protein